MNHATDHAQFIKHLEASVPTVWMIAQWLSGRGHQVTVNPTAIADSYENRMNFVDGGDLLINQRVEVKKSSREFKDSTDWPFPHFFICAKHSYDNAVHKPYAYIIVSSTETHMAIVTSDTKKHWYVVEDVVDKRYGDMKQDVYAITPDRVKWIER